MAPYIAISHQEDSEDIDLQDKIAVLDSRSVGFGKQQNVFVINKIQ